MVVLTDGDIFEDPLNLTTVINSPKMQDVERFAIGVRARGRGRLLTLYSLGGEETGYGGLLSAAYPNSVLFTKTHRLLPVPMSCSPLAPQTGLPTEG